MKLVSPILKRVVYPGLARTGYLRRHAREGPAVVTYHGVLPEQYRVRDTNLDGNLVTTASLRRQLELLRAHYNVISPEEFLSWCRLDKPLPPRSVLLTCDDGLQNVLTFMLPVLQEQRLSCLFFITGLSLCNEPAMLWYEELYLMFLDGSDTADLKLPEIDLEARAVGREQKRLLWWTLVKKFSRFSSPERAALLLQVGVQLGLREQWYSAYLADPVFRSRFCVLTLVELRKLANSGMAIGAHTLSHPVLSQQPPEGSWAEISESRRVLEQSLDCKIWAFAYPFGEPSSVGAREVEMAHRAGFDCAFLNMESRYCTNTKLFALPRIHVTAQMDLSEFEAHVSDFYRSLRRRFGFEVSELNG